jgi:hypothetical protein
LPARTANSTLNDLAALRAQYNAGRTVSLPLVQISSASGQTFEGYVVAVDSPSQRRNACPALAARRASLSA